MSQGNNFPARSPGSTSGKHLSSPSSESQCPFTSPLCIMLGPPSSFSEAMGSAGGWSPGCDGFCVLALASHSLSYVAAWVAHGCSCSGVPLPQGVLPVGPSPSEHHLLCHGAPPPTASTALSSSASPPTLPNATMGHVQCTEAPEHPFSPGLYTMQESALEDHLHHH